MRQPVSLAPLFLALFIAASPISFGKDLADRDWVEVRSDNFRVRSVLGREKAVDLVHSLELLHATVPVLTNAQSAHSPIPTEIFVLRSGDTAKLGVDRNVAGLFMPGLRSNVIVVRDTTGVRETSTIQHEYVHFLLRNQTRLRYPRWFDEGFAEYLSATRLTRGKFQVGRVPEERAANLKYSNWIAMRKIISDERYDKLTAEGKSMFYAEAWALVHFLQTRQLEGHDFVEPFADYLRRVDAGEGDVEAFEAAFGMTAREINRKVKKYLERGRFKGFELDADKLLPDFAPEVLDLSRAEAALGLAQLALRMGELDLAEGWYTVALDDERLRAHAEAGLGDVWKFRGNMENAKPHFDTALALAPEDPHIQLDVAEFWHARVHRDEDAATREASLRNARSHYVKAWKLNDQLPETYAMYGQTYLLPGQDHAKAIEMLEEAEYLLPSSLEIRLMLAEAYLGTGRDEDAANAARSVVAWSHNESRMSAKAREILQQLSSTATEQQAPMTP